MHDQATGSRAEIEYTHGYYQGLNPLRARLALLLAGLHCPVIDTACELGYGQGMSVNLHAAASRVAWHGTDSNPAYASFAGEIATACGSEARLAAEPFADYVARPDLPDFDFIGLHGVWSWVSAENRALLVDFIRRRLKPGGVVYLSYNALPGWASFAPMRHLLVTYAASLGAAGQGMAERIDQAFAFVEELLAARPLFADHHPTIKPRLAQCKRQDRAYLAHEFFTRDWQPMHFAEVAACLVPAQLAFACSAHFPDHLDMVNLNQEQRAFLAEIPDPVLREGVRDFFVNQWFRRDYWVKGMRGLPPVRQAGLLAEARLVLQTPRAEVGLQVRGVLGTAEMDGRIYGPLLDQLADHRPRSLGQIERAVCTPGLTRAHLHEAVRILVAAGHLAPVQEEAAVKRARKHTDRCNAHLLHQARCSDAVTSLASPVTGGGVPVDRVEQLFLLTLALGHRQPAEWAARAWETLAAEGRQLLREGVPLATAADNRDELHTLADRFAARRLPVLQALQVV